MSNKKPYYILSTQDGFNRIKKLLIVNGYYPVHVQDVHNIAAIDWQKGDKELVLYGAFYDVPFFESIIQMIKQRGGKIMKVTSINWDAKENAITLSEDDI